MRVKDVPITAGALWIKEAFRLFKAQPLAWISLTSAWMLLSLLLGLFVPFIGSVIAATMQPGFFAGFVIACRDQEMGKPVLTSHLFAGFSLSGRTLIQVGAISAFVQTLVILLFMPMGLAEFMQSLQALQGKTLTPEMVQGVIKGKEALLYGVMLAMLFLDAIFWFAAAVMAHQPMPATHAIRWSIFAIIANPLAVIAFGALLMLCLFVALIPWFLGLLLFFPLYAIVHYTSFKSVFQADVEESPPPPSAPPPADNSGGGA
jgi:hypothetical protein